MAEQAEATMGGWRDRHTLDLVAILLSGAVAVVWPLQTLVLAYVFLGPFHYLTEMAWLERKDFYFGEGLVRPRVYFAIAAVLCVAGSVDFYVHRGMAGYAIGLLLVLSLSAMVRSWRILLAVLAAGYAAKFFVHGMVFFVGAIVPTILHVYVFMLLFLLSGAMRESKRTVIAWVNPVLLVAMPLVLMVRAGGSYAAPAGIWIRGESGLFGLHAYLAHLLGANVHPDGSILANPASVMVLRFLAFIYLYHYLNWFAKTQLLSWHTVSRRSWVTIGGLYAAAIGCYLVNFRVGFYLVNFLSLLHVLLEFPLNWRTAHFVVTGMGRRIGILPEKTGVLAMRTDG